jgi:hypothetical protein
MPPKAAATVKRSGKGLGLCARNVAALAATAARRSETKSVGRNMVILRKTVMG